MSNSIRLTVGQALVRFVARQYVERRGRENRFIEGIWGIFGHGNVGGLEQGIVEDEHDEEDERRRAFPIYLFRFR